MLKIRCLLQNCACIFRQCIICWGVVSLVVHGPSVESTQPQSGVGGNVRTGMESNLAMTAAGANVRHGMRVSQSQSGGGRNFRSDMEATQSQIGDGEDIRPGIEATQSQSSDGGNIRADVEAMQSQTRADMDATVSQSGGGGKTRPGTIHTGGGTNYVSERTQIAFNLLHQYDHMLFPGFHSGNKTRVSCGIYVNSFDSINVGRMDVTVSIYLRQIWEDTRLQFGRDHPDVPQITLDSNYQGRVWVPDTFFPNEKRAKKHRVTVPNSLLRIYQNGTVFHSARYTLILSCPMDLYKFPLDNQECKMKIESYSYAQDELELLWFLDKPVELAPDLHLPQFELTGFTRGECSESYITGNYTCLEVKFQLGRKYGFYLVQTYIPSTLIVVLSWVSFWINHDAIPARISLGVLTVLSMTTESIGLWMTLPKVSYVKAIDIWISACVCFVFMSMMEFAAVNTLTRRDIRLSFRQPSFSDSKERKYFSDSDRQSSVSQGNGEIRKRASRYTRTLRKQQALGRRLDKICRIAFPFTFIVFTICYWSTYLVI